MEALEIVFYISAQNFRHQRWQEILITSALPDGDNYAFEYKDSLLYLKACADAQAFWL